MEWLPVVEAVRLENDNSNEKEKIMRLISDMRQFLILGKLGCLKATLSCALCL